MIFQILFYPGFAVGTRSSSTGPSVGSKFKVENVGEEVLIKFLVENAFAPIFQLIGHYD